MSYICCKEKKGTVATDTISVPSNKFQIQKKIADLFLQDLLTCAIMHHTM